jgi:hypothetical protein
MATARAKKAMARLEAQKNKQASGSLENVSIETINKIRALEGLPPISGQQKPILADADFEKLRDDYQLKNNCSKFEAHQEIVKKFPNVHRAYIEKHNPHLK